MWSVLKVLNNLIPEAIVSEVLPKELINFINKKVTLSIKTLINIFKNNFWFLTMVNVLNVIKQCKTVKIKGELANRVTWQVEKESELPLIRILY